MESDLKSLQQKIMDLETKLNFTHSDSPVNLSSQNNVQFDLGSFHSLNEEVFNCQLKSLEDQPSKKQVRIVDDEKPWKKLNISRVEEEKHIKPAFTKTGSHKIIETPKQRSGMFGSGRSSDAKKESRRPISA